MMHHQYNTAKLSWIAAQHRMANNLYDGYLPYEFHLNLTLQVCHEYKHIIVSELEKINEDAMCIQSVILPDIECGIYGHDLIENANVPYSKVLSELGSVAADIIFALTNSKGKTRKEKFDDNYYNGILDTKFAIFAKLCDRIANCRYSKFTNNKSKLDMYAGEYKIFKEKLGYEHNDTYLQMFDEISHILSNNFKQK